MELFDAHISQGAEANRGGTSGENKTEAEFATFKVTCVDDNPSYHGKLLFPRHDKLLIRQPKITLSIGETRFADFLYKNFAAEQDVLIESKNQIGKGTTDEKLIHTIEELAESEYGSCWLVLWGQGWRRRILKKTYQTAEKLSKGNKNISVIHGEGGILYRRIRKLIHEGIAHEIRR